MLLRPVSGKDCMMPFVQLPYSSIRPCPFGPELAHPQSPAGASSAFPQWGCALPTVTSTAPWLRAQHHSLPEPKTNPFDL